MFVNEVNEVKIYNLSAGKSVPEVSSCIQSTTKISLKYLLYFLLYILFCYNIVAYRSSKTFTIDEQNRFTTSHRINSRF